MEVTADASAGPAGGGSGRIGRCAGELGTAPAGAGIGPGIGQASDPAEQRAEQRSTAC